MSFFSSTTFSSKHSINFSFSDPTPSCVSSGFCRAWRECRGGRRPFIQRNSSCGGGSRRLLWRIGRGRPWKGGRWRVACEQSFLGKFVKPSRAERLGLFIGLGVQEFGGVGRVHERVPGCCAVRRTGRLLAEEKRGDAGQSILSVVLFNGGAVFVAKVVHLLQQKREIDGVLGVFFFTLGCKLIPGKRFSRSATTSSGLVRIALRAGLATRCLLGLESSPLGERPRVEDAMMLFV